MRGWAAIICLFSWIYPVQTLAFMPAVKVSINAPGLYVITQADLTPLGVDLTAVRPSNLALRHGEQSIPLRITGVESGSFGPNSQILFYAEGIAGDDPLFQVTDVNVYWLEDKDTFATSADRIQETPATPASAPLGGFWSTTEHIERDLVFEPGVSFPAGAPRWFMAAEINAASVLPERSIGFVPAQTVDTRAQASVSVTLQGKTNDPVSPDHRSQIFLNQCAGLGGVQEWDGFARFVHQDTFPAGCLIDGNNTLKVKNLGNSALVNSFLIDAFDVTYTQTSEAISDQVAFTGVSPATLTGFSTPDIDVYAIGASGAVRLLTGTSITPQGSEYQVSFDDSLLQPINPALYWALAVDEYRTPLALTLDTPSSLKSVNRQVDYLMISHPLFISAIQPLADRRREQGLRTEVVDVTDVYDEFSGGVTTDQAIRDFLSYAYHFWQVRPSYVLLVGDAANTFKDPFPGSVPTYIPTHFFRAFDGAMVPGDIWYVTVDGDDPLPDMHLGRLPVRPANVAATVQKILAYDLPSSDTSWMNQALFVADNDEPVFTTVSEEMADILAPQYQANKVYMRDNSTIGHRNEVINHLRNGNVITAYTGHGTATQWAAEAILTINDVATVTNKDRLTFFVSLNCLNGYFISLNSENTQQSLAEVFVTSQQGGAVAAWAASYLGFTTDHSIMGNKLFDSIKGQNSQRLGSITTQARIQALSAGAQEDTLDSYIYFGDPATTLASTRVVGPGSSGSGGGGGVDSLMLMLLISAVVFKWCCIPSPTRRRHVTQSPYPGMCPPGRARIRFAFVPARRISGTAPGCDQEGK
jgi:hypothetical protein